MSVKEAIVFGSAIVVVFMQTNLVPFNNYILS